ncbi:unnamed protein product [Brachionus calyciflorus]|uniref:Uncharacterized protein n=1 Tax=Brachionus calyciflorus TaxID=104777 RepID=A0A814AY49_9BILA|nr:unnamed protein product [Brachionus calyciflorus]
MGEITILLYLKRIRNLFRFNKQKQKKNLVLPNNLDGELQAKVLQSTVSIFKISKQTFGFIKNYIKTNRDYFINLIKNLREFRGLTTYKAQNYDPSHYSVLKKWQCFYVLDSASLAVYGNEINMIALSLLFLRTIKCYSLHNIAFNVYTSKKFAMPIYLSLKNEHFTPIITLNEYFQIRETNGDHLNFINYGYGELKLY